MLARNPKTGAQIRILRSDASLSRTQKTLVWLQNQDTIVPWDRWDTVCVNRKSIQQWEEVGKRVDFFLLTTSTQDDVDFFLSLNPSKYKLMFIPKALVFAIGWQKFKALQISNVIVMEEAHLMYPYLGDAWSSTYEDAMILIAGILRFSNLVGLPEGYTSERLTLLKEQSMPIRLHSEQPMPLWYITQYYRPDKARRAREIKKCLDENVKCPMIDKLVLLNEQDFSEEFPMSPKIHQEIVGKRLSYKIVMEWIQTNVPDNVLCVFANADIYLDATTWRDIWSVNLENVFLALLRWDVQEGDQPSKLFGPRNDSQDTWAVLSNSVKSRTWDFANLDIPFGKAGCDNAITVEMLRKKFLIVNPALSLKTHHLQLTNYRTYDPQNVVDKPCYMYVDPTGIHDMEPVYELTPYSFEKLQYSSFERRLRAVKAKALDVYCKMLERGERYKWKATSTNLYPEESIPLYKYQNVFQTPQGLVYGYNKIFVGKDEVSKEAWSKSELSPIHPAYETDRCFAVPWDPHYSTNPERYVVSFLPKILALRQRYGKGEFFAPEQGVVPYLECFQWSETQVPLLQHKPNVQIWCKELIQVPVQAKSEIHKEDIDILRSSLKEPWSTYQTTNKWAVMIDGKQITTEMVRNWENQFPDYEWAVMYEQRTSPDRMMEKLRGAVGCIFSGGSNSVSRWGMTWVLPRGATLIEVQNEMDPDGEAAHFAGAAGLVHSLVIVPRAAEKVTQDMIFADVGTTLKGLSVVGPLDARKPTIYLPRKSLEGFYRHAGDSFREMAKLWEEKGYVECVEHEAAVQVWFQGVGKVLLYDRPTHDWLFTARPEEQKWELALFGNPKPLDSGGPAKSWFFWPRNPKLLEQCVASGAPLKAWSQREKQVVFYGKIENKVQEKRRKTQSWASVCDEFALVEGDTTPHKLGPKEYLLALSNSKFGLCLAGYGKKCHREVECMAMGCVPVCASEVDMENYANPPQEGIHYIRVTSPEDAKEKLAAVTEQQWETMSAACIQWWRANASAEGSWALTQKLIGNP